jgi:ABC-type lipoprotein release transport system permease subunit
MLIQILRNLTGRKTRTFLTVAGIAVGVTMIVALGAMGEGLRTGYLTMFSGSGADLTIMQKGAYDVTISSVDEEVVSQVAALPDVQAATGMIVGNVTAPGSPYFFVFGYDPKEFAIQRFKLVQGQSLAAHQVATSNREIMLGRQAAESLKLQVGDVLRLTGGAFRVVGIYETGSGFEDAASVMALADAQQLIQKKRQVSAVQIKLKDARQLERVRARLERQFPRLSMSNSSQASNQQQVVGMIQGLAWGIALLAIIIGGVGMTNTVMMSVFERTREIGTLRALGWSRQRILILVLSESMGLGLIGGLLGCAAGAALIGPLGQTSALSFLQGKLTLPLLGQGMLTAIVLGAVGGIYPARWASKLLPVEALRYEGGAQSLNLELQIPAVQVGSWSFKFETVNSLLRRQGRTALTVLGIAIGLASVVTLGGLTDGFMGEYSKLLNSGDADLTARQAGASSIGYSAINDRAGKQIASLPGVQSVSGAVMGIVSTEEMPYLIVMGYDPNEPAIRHFKIMEGRELAGSREVILGRAGAEILKVRVGDVVRLREVGFRVVGLFETGVTWEEGSAIISLRDAQELLGKPRQVTMYLIKVGDQGQASTIRSQIESYIPEITVVPSSEFVESGPEMQSMGVLMWTISVLAIIVGGIGMMNTMLMSVFERTREIGTLRALGWRRKRVLVSVLQESLALALMGVILGTALSAILSVVMRQIPVWGEALIIIISANLMVQALLIALGLGAVGGLYPAWRAANLSPVEALRYE